VPEEDVFVYRYRNNIKISKIDMSIVYISDEKNNNQKYKKREIVGT